MNGLGSYFATLDLFYALGINKEDNENLIINKEKIDFGDMYDMLGISNYKNDDFKYTVCDVINDKNNIESIDGEYGDDYHFICNNNVDKRKIMLYHDSFGHYMKEYIKVEFKESYFAHHHFFNMNLVDEYKPNIFVLEIVERYIGNLLYWKY